MPNARRNQSKRCHPVLSLLLVCALVLTARDFLFSTAIAAQTGQHNASSNESQIVKDSQVKLRDWVSYERMTQLSDGTVLYQYVSQVAPQEAESANSIGAGNMPWPELQLSFIPRFNCAPIVSVVLALDQSNDMAEAEQEKLLSALGQMKFRVDGTTIAFPTLTERSGSQLLAHYDTELRRRNNFRILVEAGSTAQIGIDMAADDSHEYNYSLSGSKRAIKRSLSSCQTHTNN